MNKFDKKIKELSRQVEIPKSYSQKIESVLDNLPAEEEEPPRTRRLQLSKHKLAFITCCIVLCCILTVGSIEANANIFDSFRQTILDILNISSKEEQEKLGVESITEEIQSKPDLMLEMQEVITAPHGVYVLVKVTAPPNIELNKDITFDYFAFSEGTNFNTEQIIEGARDCYLLEVLNGKPNVATYVITISADMKPYFGNNITAYFKDLTRNPNEPENAERLVEGMWSISFLAEQTVKESITLEGNSDLEFPFLDTTSYIKEIEMSPLGFHLLHNVSNIPMDVLNVSDSSVSIRAKMVDGTELYISEPDPDGNWNIDSGSIEMITEGEDSYQKIIYSFTEAVDISKVVGFYIEDVYFPLERMY